MKFSKFVSNFDYVLFFTVIILTVIGILFIYSANLNKSTELQSQFIKQILFTIISLIILITIMFISEKYIIEFSFAFYIFCIIGLAITLFFPEVKGQKRFSFFFVSVQFSEFMKIASILMLSKFYANSTSEEIRKLTTYLKASIFILIPVVFILLQPDLGTMLVYFPIFLGISYMAGIKKRYLLYTILLFLFVAFIPVVTSINKLFFENENEILSLFTNTKYVIIMYIFLSITLSLSVLSVSNIIKGINLKMKRIFYWLMFFTSVFYIGTLLSYPVDKYVLESYQKDRIMIFFNPYFDPKGKGYNIIQSITTIGNGGILGKGWCKGEQIQNFFLPEQATDFIYPVIAEEKGFIGSFIILFLYSLIFYRSLYAVLNTKNYWKAYTIIGIIFMMLFHIIQNMGMSIGIMPITGIPLPFLSYGGSFLITCFMGIGLIMNFELNRYHY